MDLLKAFDTLNHNLLKAKLSAYSFKDNALTLIYSYFTNRWNRTKISSWRVIHVVRTHKGGGEGSRQVRTIAYKGAGAVSRLRTYAKNFWTTKYQTFLFLIQKKLLYCHLLLCIEKCKPALSNKQKPWKPFWYWFSET